MQNKILRASLFHITGFVSPIFDGYSPDPLRPKGFQILRFAPRWQGVQAIGVQGV